MTNLRPFLLLLMSVALVTTALLAQTVTAAPTVREALAANGISDLRRFPDYFLNAKVAPERPDQRYIHVRYHINPSAETLFVFSRDLQLVGELDGWELATLPDDTIFYHQNQIHF